MRGDDIDHRRLTGAVGTDEAHEGAALDIETDSLYRLDAAEALADIAALKNGGHWAGSSTSLAVVRCRPTACQRSCKAPHRPPRKNKTQNMIRSPKTIWFHFPKSWTACWRTVTKITPNAGPTRVPDPPMIT